MPAPPVGKASVQLVTITVTAPKGKAAGPPTLRVTNLGSVSPAGTMNLQVTSTGGDATTASKPTDESGDCTVVDDLTSLQEHMAAGHLARLLQLGPSETDIHSKPSDVFSMPRTFIKNVVPSLCP